MPELTAVFQRVAREYIGFGEELPGANIEGATPDEVRANLADPYAGFSAANEALQALSAVATRG